MGVVTIAPADLAPANRDSGRLLSALEDGDILFFASSPIEITASDREFLLARRQTGAGYHKNIAYRPARDRVTGLASVRRADAERLRGVMRRYSRSVVAFLTDLFPSYARSWKLDYASFRPQEEEGRDLPIHSKNDLMHVDAFPTRPTRGDRILRFFNNINPADPRRWMTGVEKFEALAQRFALPSGLLDRARRPGLDGRLRALGSALGLGVSKRSVYDEFMLRFHHFLKENREYQSTAEREFPAFPPGSAWMVYTDMVSHAVLSGRFALEQTFLIARPSMADPRKAPLAVLERIGGAPLV